MLNLARLRVLSEVIQRGSFSAAADALDYTQSAISQSIARLEAETGAALVVRNRRGIRATAAGATLLQHADAIFGQVQAAEDDLAAVLGVRGGRLRMASFPSAGSTLIPQAVAAFRYLHPEVDLSLRRGRARGDRSAPARRRVRPRAAVRVSRGRRGVRQARDDAADQRPDVGHAAGGAPARAQARLALLDLRNEYGCRHRRRARALDTSYGSATRRALSRASRSRAMTTTPSRASSQLVSASL